MHVNYGYSYFIIVVHRPGRIKTTCYFIQLENIDKLEGLILFQAQ